MAFREPSTEPDSARVARAAVVGAGERNIRPLGAAPDASRAGLLVVSDSELSERRFSNDSR